MFVLQDLIFSCPQGIGLNSLCIIFLLIYVFIGFKFCIYAEEWNREFDTDFSLVPGYAYAAPGLLMNWG